MTSLWKEIQPSDAYKIQLNGQLNEKDRELLLYLYQPLLGADAISLYNILWLEVDRHTLESDVRTHKTLMDLMAVSIERIFQARIRLEGMGLLKTYLKTGESKEYAYQLQPPLSAKAFFEDPMLSVFLYRQIGTGQFQRLKKKFTIPFDDLHTYEEVTRSFQDVFYSDAKVSPHIPEKTEEGKTLVFRAENSGVAADFQNFDFHALYAGLSEAMVPRKALTYDVKQLIVKLSLLYGLSEQDMKNPILSSVTEEDKVDKEALRKACRDSFQLKNKSALPALKKYAEAKPVQELPGSEDQTLKYLKKSSPVQVLIDASKGVKPSTAELQLIDYLIHEKKLPDEVVNVLIQFVLLRTNMKLTKGFTEQIASQWVRIGIETAEQAMAEAKKEHKNYLTWKKSGGNKPARKEKTIRKEKLPEWFTSDESEESEDPAFLEERARYLKERELKKRKAGDE
ncbi:replication initiation and membrane attachment family protein [Jeotgalibacillus salarius]|uniref:Replication initiation and membrane attachment protein n=1 Tax=Jeotgalibacillus salarius TaxID=546023 RepID=A0A4Y8LE62_9BACL|nr:DnaD domain protein [Jeotgalibacillus salarius]TFE00955.1 Replication initiation and membrane attachment protein [Jeotgalibacillus salarius]